MIDRQSRSFLYKQLFFLWNIGETELKVSEGGKISLEVYYDSHV